MSDPDPIAPQPSPPTVPEVRPRSELEIRWRQARNAPPPVVRAVLANVAVAVVGGLLLLYRLAGGRGTRPPAPVAPLVYVVVVIVSSLLTWLWWAAPGGTGSKPLGLVGGARFFASIPIVYLSPVVIFQVLRLLLPDRDGSGASGVGRGLIEPEPVGYKPTADAEPPAGWVRPAR
jgi:hypothetical protein